MMVYAYIETLLFNNINANDNHLIPLSLTLFRFIGLTASTAPRERCGDAVQRARLAENWVEGDYPSLSQSGQHSAGHTGTMQVIEIFYYNRAP